MNSREFAEFLSWLSLGYMVVDVQNNFYHVYYDFIGPNKNGIATVRLIKFNAKLKRGVHYLNLPAELDAVYTKDVIISFDSHGMRSLFSDDLYHRLLEDWLRGGAFIGHFDESLGKSPEGQVADSSIVERRRNAASAVTNLHGRRIPFNKVREFVYQSRKTKKIKTKSKGKRR